MLSDLVCIVYLSPLNPPKGGLFLFVYIHYILRTICLSNLMLFILCVLIPPWGWGATPCPSTSYFLVHLFDIRYSNMMINKDRSSRWYRSPSVEATSNHLTILHSYLPTFLPSYIPTFKLPSTNPHRDSVSIEHVTHKRTKKHRRCFVLKAIIHHCKLTQGTFVWKQTK